MLGGASPANEGGSSRSLFLLASLPRHVLSLFRACFIGAIYALCLCLQCTFDQRLARPGHAREAQLSFMPRPPPFFCLDTLAASLSRLLFHFLQPHSLHHRVHIKQVMFKHFALLLLLSLLSLTCCEAFHGVHPLPNQARFASPRAKTQAQPLSRSPPQRAALVRREVIAIIPQVLFVAACAGGKYKKERRSGCVIELGGRREASTGKVIKGQHRSSF